MDNFGRIFFFENDSGEVKFSVVSNVRFVDLSVETMWLKILFLVFSSVLIECAEVWAERLCERLELNNRTDFVSHNLTFDVSCNEGLAKFVRKEYPSAFEDVSFVLEPAVSRVKNHKCRRQLDSFLAALKNSSLWAVQSKSIL